MTKSSEDASYLLLSFAKKIYKEQVMPIDWAATGYNKPAFLLFTRAFVVGGLSRLVLTDRSEFVPSLDRACAGLVLYLCEVEDVPFERAREIATKIRHCAPDTVVACMVRLGAERWNSPGALAQFFS